MGQEAQRHFQQFCQVSLYQTSQCNCNKNIQAEIPNYNNTDLIPQAFRKNNSKQGIKQKIMKGIKEAPTLSLKRLPYFEHQKQSVGPNTK